MSNLLKIINNITKGERFITTEQVESIMELPNVILENCGASGSGKGILWTAFNENKTKEICEFVEVY